MNQPSLQLVSLELDKEDCSKLIFLLRDYGQNNGKDWDSWAIQINKKIQSALNNSPTIPKVLIILDKRNVTAIHDIIQNSSKAQGDEWRRWSQTICQIIDKATQQNSSFFDTVLTTISIETLGGISLPIFYKGGQLPLNQNLIFSTAEDNQKQVEIHIVYGENRKARENYSIGKYIFDGIAPAKRGVPQIELQFILEKNYNLLVKVTDKFSKHAESLPIVNVKDYPAPKVIDPLPLKKEESKSLYLSADFNDIFSEMLSGFGFSFSANKDIEDNPDINLSIIISPDEARDGRFKEIEFERKVICPTCNRLGSNPGTAVPIPCGKCNGKGRISKIKKTIFGQMMQDTICQSCNGRGIIISSPCQNCNGSGKIPEMKHIGFQIPSNSSVGSVITKVGEGNAIKNSNSYGNVYIHITINHFLDQR